MERVRGRCKLFWEVDDSNPSGSPRFEAQARVVVEHVDFATHEEKGWDRLSESLTTIVERAETTKTWPNEAGPIIRASRKGSTGGNGG